MLVDEVSEEILKVRQKAQHPIVVGISGYCGSGKSTLARSLVNIIPGSVRMRGDDFLDPDRSHQRSTNWDGVERVRLVQEVLEPFRACREGTFRRYDWGIRALGEPEDIPTREVLIVDLIGLFTPETDSVLDLKVWCDVDLETATTGGLARDAELGRNHGDLWSEVWVPNEKDFEAKFQPRERADIFFR